MKWEALHGNECANPLLLACDEKTKDYSPRARIRNLMGLVLQMFLVDVKRNTNGFILIIFVADTNFRLVVTTGLLTAVESKCVTSLITMTTARKEVEIPTLPCWTFGRQWILGRIAGIA